MPKPEPDSDPVQQHEADSGMLYALISFVAFTARGPIVDFLGDLFGQLDARRRAEIAEILLRLHHQVLFRQRESEYRQYEPLALSMISRHAAWSANLVVLAVLAAGEVTSQQLFPQEQNPQGAWRAEVMIWRSHLGDGWSGMRDAVAFHRVWDDQRRGFRLTRQDDTFTSGASDMYWTFDLPPDVRGHNKIYPSLGYDSVIALRKVNFVSTMSEDIMAHALAPLLSAFPATANVFVTLDDGRLVSAVHALVAALGASCGAGTLGESAYLDLALVTRRLLESSNLDDAAAYLKASLGLLISATGQGAVSPASVGLILGPASKTVTQDAKLTELLATLDRLLSA
jgi:hypothetical protein